MVIEFRYGKIIVTPHEMVVRLEGEHKATMQAASEAVQLIGGANVVVVNGSEAKWSIKLDTELQLKQIANHLGCEIS